MRSSVNVTKKEYKKKKKNMIANSVHPFDWRLLDVTISLANLEYFAEKYSTSRTHTSRAECLLALKALTLTDLTTLAADDTAGSVKRVCTRAAQPFSRELMERYIDPKLIPEIHTAAICVYPARVGDAGAELRRLNKFDDIPIAAVATGFPSGQYGLRSRLLEIEFARAAGAREIDIVLHRPLVLLEKWEELYEEVSEMRKVCGAHVVMKTILSIGELGDMTNVYKAAMVCMMAGADFIKTSTGKEQVNATLPAGLCMIYAIQAYEVATGVKVGLKPAGGVSKVKDAIAWMNMVNETLGKDYLKPHLFRFGASGLLDDIEKVVRKGIFHLDVAEGAAQAAY